MESGMPRFFFHIHNSVEAMDEEGAVLPDLRAARNEAIRNAQDIIAEEIKSSGQLHLSHWLEIEDESGNKTPDEVWRLRRGQSVTGFPPAYASPASSPAP
jgi:hypothetical protein